MGERRSEKCPKNPGGKMSGSAREVGLVLNAGRTGGWTFSSVAKKRDNSQGIPPAGPPMRPRIGLSDQRKLDAGPGHYPRCEAQTRESSVWAYYLQTVTYVFRLCSEENVAKLLCNNHCHRP